MLEEEPVPPIDLRPAIPDALSETIMRCLRKDAAERFADMPELAHALTPFGSGRFVGYAVRCHAFLNGEGPGRRSTPSALAPVSRRSTGAVPAAVSGSERMAPVRTNTNVPAVRRSIAVRLPSEVPLTRRPSQQRISYDALSPTPRVPTRVPSPVTPRQATVQFGPAPSPSAAAPAPSASDDLDFLPRKRRLNRPLVWGGALALVGVIASYLMAMQHDEHAATLKPRPAPPPTAATALEDIPVIKPSAELTGEIEATTDVNAVTEAAAASALPLLKPQPAEPAPASTPTISASSARPHGSYSRSQRTAAASVPTSSGRLSAPNRIDDEPDVGF